VGNASAGSAYQTLIQRWDGAAWTIVPSPDTSNAQTNVLDAIACTSSSACWAVGNYNNGRATRTLAASYGRSSEPTPVVPDVPYPAVLLAVAALILLAAWRSNGAGRSGGER
jgi:hypothetical protein